MKPPRLLETRPLSHQWVLGDAVPLIFGALAGLALGESKGIYAVLALLAAVGGFLAGMEHSTPAEGAARGEVGGLLFGLGILLAHGLVGGKPKASLPDPEILQIVITTVGGILLGAGGAAMRARGERRAAGATAAP
jgi:hypothetical protein